MVNVFLIENSTLDNQCIAAHISQTPLNKSIDEIIEEVNKKSEDEKINLIEKISNDYRHNIITEVSSPMIILDGISRFSMLYIWNLISSKNNIYASGIEASMRVVKPEKHIKDIDNDFYSCILDKYNNLISNNINFEDARYIIPEGASTRAAISTNMRHLNKIAKNLKKSELDELKNIGEEISKIIYNYEGFDLKEEEEISSWKIFGEYKEKEKYMSFSKLNKSDDYYFYMHSENSLSSIAQLVRQRQLKINIEPAESIIKKRRFVVPPSFDTEIKEKIYKNIIEESLKKQNDFLEKRNPKFVYYLLHGQLSGIDIFGDTEAIFNLSKSRCCGAAHWEIRSSIAIPVTRKLIEFGKYNNIGPYCYREGKCKEPNTFKTKYSKCPVYNNNINSSDINSIINTLNQNYEII